MLTDNQKLRLSDYRYWRNLVYRLGFDSSVYQPSSSGIPSLSTLSQYFDSSQHALLPLLRSMGSDKNQRISVPDVARALSKQGLYTGQGSPEADAAFQELIEMISTPSSGDGCSSESACHVHQPEFLDILTNLRLAAILHDIHFIDDDLRINLHEYRGNQVYSACPMEHPVALLFKPTPELSLSPHFQSGIYRTMHQTGEAVQDFRILHVPEASREVILGFAVKYGLNPLFMLDVFERRSTDAKACQVGNYDMCDRVAVKAAPTASSIKMNNAVPASPLLRCTPNSSDIVSQPSIKSPMWFSMIVPILRLSEHSRDTLRKYLAWRDCMMTRPCTRGKDANNLFEETLNAAPSVEIVVENCSLSMFVSGIAQGGVAIAFSSKRFELMKLETVPIIAENRCAMSDWFCKRLTNNTPPGSLPAGGPNKKPAIGGNHSGTRSTLSDRVSDTAQFFKFNKVLSEIGTLNSRLRTGDAHSFLLKILCDVTEEYPLIAQAYGACLEILQERLHKEKNDLDEEEFRRIRNCIHQLSKLHRIVGDVAIMVDRFSSRQQWGSDAELYVSDIKSNISRFLNEVSTAKVNANCLREKYYQYCDSNSGSVLYNFIRRAFFNGSLALGLSSTDDKYGSKLTTTQNDHSHID